MNGNHASGKRALPLAVFACLVFVAADGQEIDEIREGSVGIFPDRATAVAGWVRAATLSLLEHYELVAVGEFDDLPGLREGPGALNPEDVVVTFRIRRFYKGVAADSIDVELTSDMLIVRGEGVSRYARRQKVRERQFAEWNDLRGQLARLEESLQTGGTAQAAYQSEHARLSAIGERLGAEIGAMSSKQWYVSHGKTFYDLGGAIAPGERYLIGVNRTPDRIAVYSLEELPSVAGNIFWGDAYEELEASLDGLTR